MATLYTKTTLYVFTLYNEEFDYSLTSLEASNQGSISNTNWYNSRIKLRVEIDNAQQAVSLAGSIGNAQAACDRGTFLRENQSLFY